jgi:hypothetical protein
MRRELSRLGSQVWNCEHAFSNLCPKRWSDLTPTDNPGIRFCAACSEDVTYCTTPEEFVRLGNAGQCVAVPDQHTPDSLERMLMGKPSANAMRHYRDRQQRTANWWHDVIQLAPRFDADLLAEISRLSRMQLLGKQGLSDDQREYLIKLKDAISAGPESLYRHVRIRPNGKRENQQNIFRMLRYHFDLTYRECKELAKLVDASEEK